MSDFANAVNDCAYELDKRAIDFRKGYVYTHPKTLADALDATLVREEYNDNQTVNGIRVEKTVNLPKGLVVLVHLDAMRLGPQAIAFATVGDTDE